MSLCILLIKFLMLCSGFSLLRAIYLVLKPKNKTVGPRRALEVQSRMPFKKTEISAQHEFPKPKYPGVYYVRIE